MHAFRITRNSDLYIDEEEAENLLRTIEQELRRSSRGNAVRLEIEADCPEDFQALLLELFNLLPGRSLQATAGPITMTHLMPLIVNEAFAKLKDRQFTPSYDPDLPPHGDVWQLLRREDVLLHHPYESFDSVVDLIESAATDPLVLAIKMTLYRTSGDSAIVAALIKAAQNGKQVVALVELKARFDEANNIHWARKLEEAGAHVVYGLVGLKTHCKALLIVRRDEDRIRHYAHLGTGNYHPKTARIYTDLSLFTSEPKLTQELATLFNTLTGLAEYPGFEKMLVSPFDLCRAGQGFHRARARSRPAPASPAGSSSKINSLVDDSIITALYEASCAGVKIDLIVRGICCLRPRLPGREREHPRHLHRGPLPGAQPHLLFRERRQPAGLPLQRGLDAAKFLPAGGDRLPDRGPEAARRDQGRDPAGFPERPGKGARTAGGRHLPPAEAASPARSLPRRSSSSASGPANFSRASSRPRRPPPRSSSPSSPPPRSLPRSDRDQFAGLRAK